MAVKNKKNIGLYSGSLYVLSVVATMSLYFSDAEKANATVGSRVGSVVSRVTSSLIGRTGSVVTRTGSGLGSNTGSSGRALTNPADSGLRLATTVETNIPTSGQGQFPTHKVTHKFGVNVDEFVPVGPIDLNKRYVQYVTSSGELRTYERNMATRFELFLKGEIGRDKYVDTTTGRVTSYIYRSKPKWIIGSDIIQAQQAKLEETGSINSVNSAVSSVSSVSANSSASNVASNRVTSSLNLNMVKNPDGGVSFVEDKGSVGTVKVNNPELIATAQKIADGLKVNERKNVVLRNPDKSTQTPIVQVNNTSSQTDSQSSQSGTSGSAVGTVKVNNPGIMDVAKQIASKLKVSSGTNDTSTGSPDKATQTPTVQVTNTSSQTDSQSSQSGTSGSAVGTVKVNNPSVMDPARNLASKLKVKDTSSSSTGTSGTSQTGQVTTPSTSTSSSKQVTSTMTSPTSSGSEDGQHSTQGTSRVRYRTELRIQIGGKDSKPVYTESVKNVTLKIPQTSGTQGDVTNVTETDKGSTQQTPTGKVSFKNPVYEEQIKLISSRLKTSPETKPTDQGNTTTSSSGVVKLGNTGVIGAAQGLANKLKVKETDSSSNETSGTTQTGQTSTTSTPPRFTSSVTITPSAPTRGGSTASGVKTETSSTSTTTPSTGGQGGQVTPSTPTSTSTGSKDGQTSSSTTVTPTRFTSSITITPSAPTRGGSSNKDSVKKSDQTLLTGTAQSISSGQKKNIDSSSTGTSSSALVKTKSPERGDTTHLQRTVTVSDTTSSVAKPGKVQALSTYFETASEEDKKPKASNMNGNIHYSVGKQDGKLQVLSKTVETNLTDEDISKLKVDQNFADQLNKQLADGYQKRFQEAQRNYQ
ncbi:Hypothetical protein SFBmNL_01122 [Candidatus Arthromitus sp. SFB-mouse-NL]|nr:Hypothetical protein SFBmNL_01122 [Candidatus Arthromitus sp. SFB-mouse-NL]